MPEEKAALNRANAALSGECLLSVTHQSVIYLVSNFSLLSNRQKRLHIGEGGKG